MQGMLDWWIVRPVAHGLHAVAQMSARAHHHVYTAGMHVPGGTSPHRPPAVSQTCMRGAHITKGGWLIAPAHDASVAGAVADVMNWLPT